MYNMSEDLIVQLYDFHTANIDMQTTTSTFLEIKLIMF